MACYKYRSLVKKSPQFLHRIEQNTTTIRMKFLTIGFLLAFLVGSTMADKGCRSQPAYHRVDSERLYHFSWRNHPNRKFNWDEGRRYCESLCMDLVSLETPQQWQMVKETFRFEPTLEFIWTSGRKCNYPACKRFPHLQPAIENGWFWAINPKKVKIPNPFGKSCTFCEWGPIGTFGNRQPDNREGIQKGRDEGCLAILNNLYKDGLKWHDVACHHKKPVICQKDN